MNIKIPRIGCRLTLGFGAVLILLGIISEFCIWRLQQAGNAAETIAKYALVKARITVRWRVAICTFAQAKSNDAADLQYFQGGNAQTSRGMAGNSKNSSTGWPRRKKKPCLPTTWPNVPSASGCAAAS